MNQRIRDLSDGKLRHLLKTLYKNRAAGKQPGTPKGGVYSTLYRYVGIQFLVFHFFGFVEVDTGNLKRRVSEELVQKLESRLDGCIGHLFVLFDPMMWETGRSHFQHLEKLAYDLPNFRALPVGRRLHKVLELEM